MRSTTSSHRRLHPPPPLHRQLAAVAQIVDDAAIEHPGHVLIHVIEEPHDLVVGLLPLDRSVHPFDALAGFTAPATWTTFGMRVRGTAHHLEQPGPPEPTSTTYLVHRSGEECSILHAADGPTPLRGPAQGTLPDVARRVLGLATDPAPSSSSLLWTVAWLDRILEAVADPAPGAPRQSSWSELAQLHPAVSAVAAGEVDDPAGLIALARDHVDAWPWHRLRHEPGALPLPGGDLPPHVTTWMDDGFYARWALGAFPSVATLAGDLHGLLDAPVCESISEVLIALLI